MMAADFPGAAVYVLQAETPEPIRFDAFIVDESAIGDLLVLDFLPFKSVAIAGPDGILAYCYPVPLADLPSFVDSEPQLPEGWWDSWETEFTNTLGDEIESLDNNFRVEPDFPWGGGVEIISRDLVDPKSFESVEVLEGFWDCHIGYVPGIGIVPMTFRPGVGWFVDWPSDWVGGRPEPGKSSDFPEFDLVDEVLIDEVLAAKGVEEPIPRSPRSAAFAEMSTMAAAAMAAHLQGNATDFTPTGSGRRRR